MPYEPKAEWRNGQWVLGFLKDDRTLMTVPMASATRSAVTPVPGEPVHLFNVETGQKQSVALGERVGWLELDQAGKWLIVSEDVIDPRGVLKGSVLRVIDPFNRKQETRVVVQDSVPDTWHISPDGRTAVHSGVNTNLEGYDVLSGAWLWTARVCDFGLCFSDDGKLLAAARAGSLDVLNVRSGQRIAKLNSYEAGSPVEFSPDGRLLLVRARFIWDLTLPKVRFRLSPETARARFSADGKSVMALVRSFSGCDLRYYDTATGQEFLGRRVTLLTGPQARLFLYWPVVNRRVLLAHGGTAPSQPNLIEKWLARIPGFERLGEVRDNQVYILLNPESGRTIVRRTDHFLALSNDCRYLVTTKATNVRLWELPLRTPWRTVVLWGGAWSVVLVAVGWVVQRRRRRREEGAVDPGTRDRADGKAVFADAGL
jgi:WD40 repeat protein